MKSNECYFRSGTKTEWDDASQALGNEERTVPFEEEAL